MKQKEIAEWIIKETFYRNGRDEICVGIQGDVSLFPTDEPYQFGGQNSEVIKAYIEQILAKESARP